MAGRGELIKYHLAAIPLVILLTTWSVTVLGQSSAAAHKDELVDKLDKYLISARNAYKFNGTALVARRGQVLLRKAYGWKNVESKQPNQIATRFPILSITKSITATVVLKLQEEKKLSVRDKLSHYFSEFPNGEKITIHHLLAHSSGIHNYSDAVGIEDSLITNYPISKEKVLDYIMKKPADFQPGENYSYNNSGYYLLGLIIEKVTGKPYETVVREMIFDPLGMTHSGFDFINLPDSIKAQGYQFLDAERVVRYKHFDSTYAYAAGSVYSTVEDLFQWASAVAGKQILSTKSWDAALTPKMNGYGYGWMTGQFYGKKYVRHSGGYPGFVSELIYYPDDGITIILLNNFGNYEQSVWPVGMGLAGILLHKPYDLWKARKEITLATNVLQQYVGTYKFDKKKDINVRIAGSELFVDIPGIPSLKLFAESDYLFYVENFNTEYRFVPDEKGIITKLIIHEHGVDYELKKK